MRPLTLLQSLNLANPISNTKKYRQELQSCFDMPQISGINNKTHYNCHMTIKKFSPCKVNLMLAVTGIRPDGFHNLISLVTPVNFGDDLTVSILPENATSDSIECNAPGIPLDSSNLVIKAAELFRKAADLNAHFSFSLTKRVPAGAGLGGGSSNGAAALAAMNELCQQRLSDKILEDIAAKLGSDCPLFLTGTPVVMRGRGEIVYPLFGDAQYYISKLKILLFKPDFSINTGWAYAQMRANPSDYMDRDLAESKISEWLENPSITGIPLINNMQIEAFKKYPALEIAIEEIKNKFGVPAMMSGSGSACFAIVNNLDSAKIENLKMEIKSLLGDSCFLAEAW